MIKVTVPNKSFDGIRAGVKFDKGEAICEAKYANELKALGYSVEALESDKESKPKTKKTPAKKAPKKAGE